MTDIRLVEIKSLDGVSMDFLLLPSGELDETEELATLVRVALGTDRLADEDEVLPGLEDDTDRRGWWGDLDAEVIWDGWPIGVKNWLLRRAKITGPGSKEGSTLARAERYCEEALMPLRDRRVFTDFEVNVERASRTSVIVRIMIYRGPRSAIELRYQMLWEEI